MSGQHRNVGFIGLGAMGYAMAGCVRKNMSASNVLCVYDISRPVCERFSQQFGGSGSVEIVDSPAVAARDADILISIVPTAANVNEVFLDESRGVLAAPKHPQRLFLECSTIDVDSARDIAEKLKVAGAGVYVDAPVSGGVPAAETGSLTFLLGHAKGDDNITPRITEVIHMMGKPEKVFWCGGVGSGLAAKISNNYISCTVLLVIAEAMAMGVRAGIDPKLLQDVIHNSTGQTFMGDNVNPVPGVVSHAPSSNGWKLGFKTQMMIKDVTLGIESAERLGIHPSMAIAARELWKKAAQDPRCIDKDGSSVWLHITNSQD